jgi:hypothetical protein
MYLVVQLTRCLLFGTQKKVINDRRDARVGWDRCQIPANLTVF